MIDQEGEKSFTAGIEKDHDNEESATCSDCGKPVSARANFCGSCGRKMKEDKVEKKQSQEDEEYTTCSDCGKPVHVRANFCGSCGREMKKNRGEEKQPKATPQEDREENQPEIEVSRSTGKSRLEAMANVEKKEKEMGPLVIFRGIVPTGESWKVGGNIEDSNIIVQIGGGLIIEGNLVDSEIVVETGGELEISGKTINSKVVKQNLSQ